MDKDSSFRGEIPTRSSAPGVVWISCLGLHPKPLLSCYRLALGGWRSPSPLANPGSALVMKIESRDCFICCCCTQCCAVGRRIFGGSESANRHFYTHTSWPRWRAVGVHVGGPKARADGNHDRAWASLDTDRHSVAVARWRADLVNKVAPLHSTPDASQQWLRSKTQWSTLCEQFRAFFLHQNDLARMLDQCMNSGSWVVTSASGGISLKELGVGSPSDV